MDDLDFGNTVKGLAPGQRVFARYTLQRVLGRGGMGVVWLVRDEELGRDSAMKFLPEVVATDRSAIADMKREVRRAIDLAHPHIIKTHDFITDGRTAGVSMELIPGGTLAAARLDEPGQVFGAEKLGPWVRQLCAALEYAHESAEVVHRDLKPSNLMLDAKGRLKVVDFGIAASLSESVSRVSKQVGSSGTPVYMSPQQMMGEPPAVTDDLYAVGALLMELLTGKPPFHSGNLLMQVQAKVAPRVNERRAQAGLPPVPAAWDDAIAACLAKEVAQRPASAAELARLLAGDAAPAGAAPPAAPQAAPPLAVAPEPVRASGEVGPVRRWLLAPLVGALIPAATLFLLLGHDTFGGHLAPLYGVVPGIFFELMPQAWEANLLIGFAALPLVWLAFVGIVAVLHATRARGPLFLASALGTLGALATGAGVRWIGEDAIDLGYLAAFVAAGGLGGVAAAHLTFVTGFRRAGGPGAASPLFTILSVVVGLFATACVGLLFPARLQQVRDAARVAEQAAWEAHLAEENRLAEMRAEQDRARRRELRSVEAAGLVADAFRQVFERAPTPAERDQYRAALLDNLDWDARRLRDVLRSSPMGAAGGRLRVPEEFPTIAAAIEAAHAGNVVAVGPGRYAEAINVRQDLVLAGAGAGKVVVEVSPEQPALWVEGARVAVRGFTFRHTGKVETDQRYTLVCLNQATEVRFEDNRLEAANGHALYVKGPGLKVVRRNVVVGAGWCGIMAYAEAEAEIRENRVEDTNLAGIAVGDAVRSVVIAGNRVQRSRQSGIWIAAGDNVVLEGNEVSANGTAEALYGGINISGGRPRLQGNVAQGNFGTGIWWSSDKAEPVIGPGNLSDGELLPERR